MGAHRPAPRYGRGTVVIALLFVVIAIAALVWVTSRVSAPQPDPEPLTAPTSSAQRSPRPSPTPTATAAPVDASGCSTDTYGGATERVQEVGHYLAKRFKINTVVGVADTAADDPDHAIGLALDFYFADKDSGDEFTRYLVAHRDVLDINYVLWWQRANIAGQWVTMAPRGSAHENHYDNVHVSFKADPEHTLACE